MKSWTPHHAALLDALRAERLLPALYKRLTRERYEVDEAEWQRLSEWPATLYREPSWSTLEVVIERPDAWPDAWHRACERGWSEVAEHHHALLFGRLTERLIRDGEFDHALWCWMECWRAWKVVLAGDYIPALIRDVIEEPDAHDEHESQGSPKDGREAPAHDQVALHLLEPLVQARAAALRAHLNLDDDARARRALERRAIRFEWSALTLLVELLRAPQGDACGTLEHARQLAVSQRASIGAQAVARFERLLDAVDIAQADSDELLHPFEWLAGVFDLLGPHEYASATAVTRTVALLWRLRKTGREEREGEFPRILEAMAPFQRDLRRRLEGGKTFGHNSKCADFMVFQGEDLQDRDQRFEIFSRAVAISPGHRNASMLLAYEHMHKVNEAITASALLPAPLRHLGNTRQLKLLQSARHHLSEAARHFPTHERLEKYGERLEQELARTGITLPAQDPLPDEDAKDG